jgi:LmbE family N-acetylglucosaminyl deacetylase
MADVKALVTVAHPDDETFGTGSVIAGLVAAGAHVTVCCATRGEEGEDPFGLVQGADLGDVREGELRAAGAVLGVHDFVLLGLRDSGMTGDAGEETLAGAPVAEVVRRVSAVIDDVRPTVVVTLDPDHGDGHRDHVRIGEATVEACRGREGVDVYYWVLSRDLLRAWFAELARMNPDAAHLALDVDQQGVGRIDDDVAVVLDSTPYREVRERAMREHATQKPPFDGMPADLVDRFLGEDRLTRVLPPWTGGTPATSLL